MSAIGYTMFQSAIGDCAVAWSKAGIVALQLPESGPAATRRRLLRGLPDIEQTEPPGDVKAAIDGVARLLAGEPVELSTAPLDLADVPEFNRRVYEEIRTIPAGTTRSYGEIADALGDRRAAQAVGRALGSNPVAIIVPCHRVVAADGRIGGFSAHGGPATKGRILAIEGLTQHAPQPTLFDDVAGGDSRP